MRKGQTTAGLDELLTWGVRVRGSCTIPGYEMVHWLVSDHLHAFVIKPYCYCFGICYWIGDMHAPLLPKKKVNFDFYSLTFCMEAIV